MTDDQQRARELSSPEGIAFRLRNLAQNMAAGNGPIARDHQAWKRVEELADAVAALRAAPEGWSFQRQDDGSIIVTAHGYGVVHVRPDDSDSIAAAMLHLLADDLAARPQGVK